MKRETRVLPIGGRLPDGEDRPHLSAFPRFDTIPDFDGQTDGRLRRSIYSACKASFAERCNKNTEPVVRMAAIAWTNDANE